LDDELRYFENAIELFKELIVVGYMHIHMCVVKSERVKRLSHNEKRWGTGRTRRTLHIDREAKERYSPLSRSRNINGLSLGKRWFQISYRNKKKKKKNLHHPFPIEKALPNPKDHIDEGHECASNVEHLRVGKKK